MADTKISALSSASVLVGTEAIPGVQSGATVKLTPGQLATFFGATATGLTAVRNNGIVVLGDSNTYGQGGFFTSLGEIAARSGGLMRLLNNAGLVGQGSYDITRSIPTAVLPYNPGIVFVMQGTNDAGVTATTIANDTLAIKRLREQGIFVALLPQYPANPTSAASLTVNAAKQALVASLNDPMVVYIDFFSLIGNTSTGAWLAGMNGDNLHITPAGNRLVTDFIVNFMRPYLAPLNIRRPFSGDTGNLVPNGTFDQGTATAGVASGWTAANPSFATPSIVAPTGGDDLKGNYQRLTAAPGASNAVLQYAIPAATLKALGGKRVVTAVRVRTTGFDTRKAAGNQASYSIGFGNGSGGSTNLVGLLNTSTLVDDATAIPNEVLYFEGILPIQSGANSNQCTVGLSVSNPAAGSGNVVVDMGEVSFYSLEPLAPPVQVPTDYRSVGFAGTYTIASTDQLVSLDLSGSNTTVTLPNANTRLGVPVRLHRPDATSGRSATFNVTGGGSINGQTSFVALTSQYETVDFVSNGSNWIAIQATPTFLAQTATANAQLLPSLPVGCRIESIELINTTANAITGVAIGTASAGAQVVAATNVGASVIVTIADAAILQRLFSTSAAQALWISASAWNSGSLSVRIKFSKVP